MRVIIDCDPGHDDIVAILAALAHPETFTIRGITTVAGNQTIEKVTDNILRVLDYLGLSVPVAQGAGTPLRRLPEPQPEAHGESGIDGLALPPAHTKPLELGAVPFLYETIMAEPEPVTLITLAPLTNIALLLTFYPGVEKRIAGVHMMGGSLYTGNILARAEFNIYHDPEAARIVFRSGIPITMSGLEICERACTYFSEYEPLAAGGKASRIVYDLMTFYSGYNRRRGKDYTTIFDAVPVLHLLAPTLFTSRQYNIDIETEGALCRGMTVVDSREDAPVQNHVTVLETVDRDAYTHLLLQSLSALDKMVR